jgi:hypothetical protein
MMTLLTYFGLNVSARLDVSQLHLESVMIRRSGHGLLFVFHALEAKEILQPGLPFFFFF